MRIDNFLEGYEFHPNSVDFRIISSKALEKFKNVQAFNLNEIRNGKYVFDKPRRELLLLRFDLITRVLHEIENLCIEHYNNSKVLTPYVLEYSLNILDKATEKYKKLILEEHPEAFDLEFSKIWVKISNIHEYIQESELVLMVGQPLEIYFNELVNLVIKCCQDSMFSLFELDVHLTKQGYFKFRETLSQDSNTDQIKYTVNDLVINPMIKTGTELTTPEENKKALMVVISSMTNSSKKNALRYLKKRILVYIEKFKIDSLFIKNLSDKPIEVEVLKLLESFNIEIDYTRSLIS